MKTIVKSVLYYRCGKNDFERIALRRSEYIVSEHITYDVIRALNANEYKVIFIGKENIFSHSMNVLRKAVNDTNVIIVIGVNSIINILQNTKECVLELRKNKIILDNNEYLFQNFNFGLDADEEIEYNVVSECICYKPDYYYNNELAQIIKEGFDQSKVKVNEVSNTFISEDMRIWNKGIGFPSDIYSKIMCDMKYYYVLLLEYANVLQKIMKFYNNRRKDENLFALLVEHFSYSTLFSFDLSIASYMLYKDIEGEQIFEKCYQAFSLITPIVDKEKLTVKEINRVKRCLNYLINGEENKFLEIYPEFGSIKLTKKVVLFFMMHLFSDIRRCIISMLIKNNDWFSSICTHKSRKEEVY